MRIYRGRMTMTDIQRIVDYLSKGNTMTALEAAKKLDMPKFTSRVSDARKMGIKIFDQWEDPSDGRRPYKIYFMKEADDGQPDRMDQAV